TDDANLVRQLKGRLEHPVNHRLRDHIGYADHEPRRLPRRPALQRVLELLAEREDLIGVAKGDAPAVGQNQVATAASEQLLTQDLFGPVDLPADRRVRQAKSGTGSRDASMLRDHPEVQDVMVIQPLHRARSMSLFSNLDSDRLNRPDPRRSLHIATQ